MVAPHLKLSHTSNTQLNHLAFKEETEKTIFHRCQIRGHRRRVLILLLGFVLVPFSQFFPRKHAVWHLFPSSCVPLTHGPSEELYEFQPRIEFTVRRLSLLDPTRGVPFRGPSEPSHELSPRVAEAVVGASLRKTSRGQAQQIGSSFTHGRAAHVVPVDETRGRHLAQQVARFW